MLNNSETSHSSRFYSVHTLYTDAHINKKPLHVVVVVDLKFSSNLITNVIHTHCTVELIKCTAHTLSLSIQIKHFFSTGFESLFDFRLFIDFAEHNLWHYGLDVCQFDSSSSCEHQFDFKNPNDYIKFEGIMNVVIIKCKGSM